MPNHEWNGNAMRLMFSHLRTQAVVENNKLLQTNYVENNKGPNWGGVEGVNNAHIYECLAHPGTHNSRFELINSMRVHIFLHHIFTHERRKTFNQRTTLSFIWFDIFHVVILNVYIFTMSSFRHVIWFWYRQFQMIPSGRLLG